MEHYSVIKKHGILSCAPLLMEPEITMLREINRAQNDSYCTTSLMCGILKKVLKTIKCRLVGTRHRRSDRESLSMSTKLTIR